MKTWYDFIKKIKATKKKMGSPPTLWFRGHSSTSYVLTPTLLRHSNGLERERFLFNKFSDYASKIFDKQMSEWETLFYMQHYGVPTRLLDWTEAFGVAVFFAVSNKNDWNEDGSIVLLDPVKLNKKNSIGDILIIGAENNGINYRDVYLKNDIATPHHPTAISPYFVHERLFAQKGRFTVHGNNLEPLDIQAEDVYKKVIIPKEIKPELMEFLDFANLNALTVFPDMTGISQYLNVIAELE